MEVEVAQEEEEQGDASRRVKDNMDSNNTRGMLVLRDFGSRPTARRETSEGAVHVEDARETNRKRERESDDQESERKDEREVRRKSMRRLNITYVTGKRERGERCECVGGDRGTNRREA